MKVKYSEFLERNKILIRKLINMLSENYQYVSILGTDIKGKYFWVSKTETMVSNSSSVERGFVVRVYNGIKYSEYSFNELNEDNLCIIVENIKTKLNRIPEDVQVLSYGELQEKEAKDYFFGEVEINPMDISPEEVIKSLTEIRDAAFTYSELIQNFFISYEVTHVSKLYMSNEKDLQQSYIISEGCLTSLVKRGEITREISKSLSGLMGFEVVKDLKVMYKEVVELSIELLDAQPVVPGEYDIVCAPDVAGLIAHEAFGHGVEMDMFVKGRAKGSEFIGKQIASKLVTLRDEAASTKHTASYLFDDEGTIGANTIIIENGILKNGISDQLSASKLGTTPTGNGRRESFRRKAYARMSNTFFEHGNDKLEDMVASIQEGYLLQEADRGMEDPKNWGIQCNVILGREIKNGKLTGKIVSPVIITGYVPDLLKSISMVSEKIKVYSGYCGKGYKETVNVSFGGPYIKAKARLG